MQARLPVFFLYSYVDHFLLHSFPTRRSSDLIFLDGAEKVDKFETDLKEFKEVVLTKIIQAEEGKAKRSEEHTSELQSRGHLVCRLLLEKKKKKIEASTKVTQRK